MLIVVNKKYFEMVYIAPGYGFEDMQRYYQHGQESLGEIYTGQPPLEDMSDKPAAQSGEFIEVSELNIGMQWFVKNIDTMRASQR